MTFAGSLKRIERLSHRHVETRITYPLCFAV
jgi:hypothetical protein